MLDAVRTTAALLAVLLVLVRYKEVQKERRDIDDALEDVARDRRVVSEFVQ